jgi:hypothetical protein
MSYAPPEAMPTAGYTNAKGYSKVPNVNSNANFSVYFW